MLSLHTDWLIPAATAFEPNFVIHPAIWILNDGEFTEENGVIGGSGTTTDPYVIEGWDILGSISPLLPIPYNDYLRASILVANTTSHLVIRNVRVHDGGDPDLGIHLRNVTNVVVESVRVWNGNGGVFMTATSKSKVLHSEFFGLVQPIVITSYPYSGIRATGNLVMGNTIHDDFSDRYIGSGIDLGFNASRNIVGENTIYKVTSGINIISGSSENIVVGNHIFDTEVGVSLWPRTYDNQIRNNRIEIIEGSPHPNFGPGAGVSIGPETSGNIVQGNWISGYSRAVGMRGASDTRVSENILNGTDVGVRVIASENIGIMGNTVSAPVGVLLVRDSSTKITSNNIQSSETGIDVFVSEKTILIGNSVTAPIAISVCGSHKTVIRHNHLLGSVRETVTCPP